MSETTAITALGVRFPGLAKRSLVHELLEELSLAGVSVRRSLAEGTRLAVEARFAALSTEERDRFGVTPPSELYQLQAETPEHALELIDALESRSLLWWAVAPEYHPPNTQPAASDALDPFGGVQGQVQGTNLRPLQGLPGGRGRPSNGKRFMVGLLDRTLHLHHPQLRSLRRRVSHYGRLGRTDFAHCVGVLSLIFGEGAASDGSLGGAPDAGPIGFFPASQGQAVDAIGRAVWRLQRGDLLIAPYGYRTSGPLTTNREADNLIRILAARGITAVLGLGNQGDRLDGPVDHAVIVGARSPHPPNESLGNHGTAAHSVAWGTAVDTAWIDHDHDHVVGQYLDASSLATTILGAGLAVLQSLRLSDSEPALEVSDFKRLLPAGRQPDFEAIYEAMQSSAQQT